MKRQRCTAKRGAQGIITAECCGEMKRKWQYSADKRNGVFPPRLLIARYARNTPAAHTQVGWESSLAVNISERERTGECRGGVVGQRLSLEVGGGKETRVAASNRAMNAFYSWRCREKEARDIDPKCERCNGGRKSLR